MDEKERLAQEEFALRMLMEDAKAMDFDEYQAVAGKTAPAGTRRDQLTQGALGVAGEAGEIANLIEKAFYQGRGLDEVVKMKLEDELGDLLWYVALIAEGLGVSLGDVAARNISKLRARHGESFKTYGDQGR